MKNYLLSLTFVAGISFATQAQNLILNPSCDDALVSGNIPHWQEITGTAWGQRCSDPSPLPGNGTCYFYAGSDALDVLEQTIDVSAYAATIDNGAQTFYFHGYETSYVQSPADEANIFIEFTDAAHAVLSTIHLGPYTQTAIWQELDSAIQVPVLTRNATVRLRSVRHSGSNNDGYYDELYLGSVPPLGVADRHSSSAFSIYPNPSAGELTIALGAFPKEKTVFTLTDLFGRKIKELEIVSDNTVLKLDEPRGIYFVTIATNTTITATKVMVE